MSADKLKTRKQTGDGRTYGQTTLVSESHSESININRPIKDGFILNPSGSCIYPHITQCHKCCRASFHFRFSFKQVSNVSFFTPCTDSSKCPSEIPLSIFSISYYLYIQVFYFSWLKHFPSPNFLIRDTSSIHRESRTGTERK